MIRLLFFCIVICLSITAVLYSQTPSYEQLKNRNEELEQEIAALKKIIEGTEKPIDLCKTSLTRVTALSVNGGRPLTNKYYGILNAFDGGENWINNINYSYWLSGGGSVVDIYFDAPVSVTSIFTERAPSFITEMHFQDGKLQSFTERKEKLDFEKPIHEVNKVRLKFVQQTGNLRVDEIKIFGYVPHGVEYSIELPRLFLTTGTAKTIALEAYNNWVDQLMRHSGNPIVEEDDNQIIFTFHKEEMNILRVAVNKSRGQVTTEPLVELVNLPSVNEADRIETEN